MSVFDIVGPIMIGPSSSHTAGAARLGLLARSILKEIPVAVVITLYGSFAKTYRGHGTDRALVAGLLGCNADDVKIRDAFSLAKAQGLDVKLQCSDIEVDHPNTVRINMVGEFGKKMEVVGVSLGGGKVALREIDGFVAEVTGEAYTIITRHTDQPGVISQVTTLLAEQQINISSMKVFRRSKNEEAVMIIDTDNRVADATVKKISLHPAIHMVIALDPL